jgi:ribosomal protein S18 acetylase RimI-like enzyme
MDTYELSEISEVVLHNLLIQCKPGHYTAKIDPLDKFAKKLLNDYGFYYCDTLLEPYCTMQNLITREHHLASISSSISLNEVVNICHGAFSHGRFHRDFNLDTMVADRRYNLWLEELFYSGNVWGLLYEDKVVGFWAFKDERILLHAIDPMHRGKGISKYLWELACKKMFSQGNKEIKSSISATNMPALNLYVSLGFSFRNPIDTYHYAIKTKV